MARIGYVRTAAASNREADLVQTRCDRIAREDQGERGDLPVLRELLQALVPGDQLVVPRIDQLGTSLQEILTHIIEISDAGIRLISVDEDIDTGTESGNDILALFRNLAQVNHELMSERIKAGQMTAKNSGKLLGRPRSLDEGKKAEAVEAILKGGEAANVVAARFGIHPRTLYRIVREARSEAVLREHDNRQK